MSKEIEGKKEERRVKEKLKEAAVREEEGDVSNKAFRNEIHNCLEEKYGKKDVRLKSKRKIGVSK